MIAPRRMQPILLPILISFAGCGGSTPATTNKSFPVAMHAITDEGEPMPSAQFLIAGSPVGITDASGSVTTTITGEDGQTLAITINCPDGYVGPEKAISLRLAQVRKLDDNAPGVLGVEATCTRKMRDVVLVVRTKNAPPLPVDIEGRTVGRTDEQGLAHFGLQLHRDAHSLSVSLKTGSQSKLKPQNPSRVFELDGHDAVLLLDQVFAAEPKVVKVVVKPPPKAAEPEPKHIPYRIN